MMFEMVSRVFVALWAALYVHVHLRVRISLLPFPAPRSLIWLGGLLPRYSTLADHERHQL